ncbi:unnamed protein product, partial [Oppiella nova]
MNCVSSKTGAKFPASQQITFPAPITCNGYLTIDKSLDEKIEITSDKTVLFKVNNLSTYLAFANGNLFRVQMGTVSDGPCQGDSFRWTLSFLPDNRDGCTSSDGVSRWTMNY